MSEDKKIRNMSIKGFLHKAKGQVNAREFLTTHKQFLLVNVCASAPVLSDMENGLILPTPALEKVRGFAFQAFLDGEIAKAEKMNEPRESKTMDHVVTIYDASGKVLTRIDEDGDEKELVKGFDLGQRGSEWADRRLFEQESGAYAIIVHAVGSPSRIERDDAIARIFKKGPGQSCRKNAKAPGRLSFGVKAVQSRASFSGG